jgi:hypothetical protein
MPVNASHDINMAYRCSCIVLRASGKNDSEPVSFVLPVPKQSAPKQGMASVFLKVKILDYSQFCF